MLIIPQDYKSALSMRETEAAIEITRRKFQGSLSKTLNLSRISAPLFVTRSSGINDDLNGVERPVEFDIKESGEDAVIVHSLAKWKRMALFRYGFGPGEGLVTDMNAIRRDEETDNLHSLYVDQWDWEKIITPEQRNEEYLYAVVRAIVGEICGTLEHIKTVFPAVKTTLKNEVFFITSEELLQKYPGLTPSEREYEIAKEHKTVFICNIGGRLSDGRPHDGRAPDYDDWELNGDIIFWNDVLKRQFEVSSMGIRVDADSLKKQLELSGHTDRMKYDYHRMIADGTLPLTIGGGIGQSRLCMLLLGKAHIGEVQASVWPEEESELCEKAGIHLL